MPVFLSGTSGTGTVTHLSDVVTADMMNGAFSEILGVLPVVIPAVVTFVAFRKGIAFILSALRKA